MEEKTVTTEVLSDNYYLAISATRSLQRCNFFNKNMKREGGGTRLEDKEVAVTVGKSENFLSRR